ncbi:MAG: hypothetical protein WDZ69_03230 [Candidatus Pacearchaeota archaeon]
MSFSLLENFLFSVSHTISEGEAGQLFGGLMAFFIAILIVSILIGIALYIYVSFAYMRIGQKAGLSTPGLAWIPVIGPTIIAFQASDMHWWPWVVMGVSFIAGFFIDTISGVVEYIYYLFVLVSIVIVLIWSWKMFERIGRPGWWAILLLISLVNLVIIGIAAWGEGSRNISSRKNTGRPLNYQGRRY